MTAEPEPEPERDRLVAGPRHDPTGMFMPGARPVTAADWRRKRIAINVSFLWLLFPVADLLGSAPAAGRALAVLAVLAVFVYVYNVLPRDAFGSDARDWGTLARLALLVAIAVGL